ncbi:unnamed protein product [Polarella glacialis]|uniref:Uncharacterized protein n=1 Tax=Polarella glacialis TaxID=89957 RepID=A0A813FJ66_POLGL|nr:unnamed protein product [Polarella glacialis]
MNPSAPCSQHKWLICNHHQHDQQQQQRQQQQQQQQSQLVDAGLVAAALELSVALVRLRKLRKLTRRLGFVVGRVRREVLHQTVVTDGRPLRAQLSKDEVVAIAHGVGHGIDELLEAPVHAR